MGLIYLYIAMEETNRKFCLGSVKGKQDTAWEDEIRLKCGRVLNDNAHEIMKMYQICSSHSKNVKRLAGL